MPFPSIAFAFFHFRAFTFVPVTVFAFRPTPFPSIAFTLVPVTVYLFPFSSFLFTDSIFAFLLFIGDQPVTYFPSTVFAFRTTPFPFLVFTVVLLFISPFGVIFQFLRFILSAAFALFLCFGYQFYFFICHPSHVCDLFSYHVSNILFLLPISSLVILFLALHLALLNIFLASLMLFHHDFASQIYIFLTSWVLFRQNFVGEFSLLASFSLTTLYFSVVCCVQSLFSPFAFWHFSKYQTIAVISKIDTQDDIQ
jgi:hypothetical protein